MAVLRLHRHLGCRALLLLCLAAGGSARAAVAVGPSSHDTLSASCTTARQAARDQVIRLRSAMPGLQALLLGEIHTSATDHAWQLATLEAVRQRRPRLSLGLEMIPAARQQVLDRYSAGQLDEAGVLQQVGWAEVWGHDPELYLPLLRWARLRGVPLLALNAEPELVRRVRLQGWSAIPAAERQRLGRPAAAGPAYRQSLEAAWRGHRTFAGTGSRSHGSGGAAADSSAALTPAEATDLQRFLDSQLLRDRVMAERIVAALHRDPGRLVVALIGRGHLENGDGVPRQLSELGLVRQLSLSPIPLPAGCGPAPAGARLGAYLESENGAVWVRRVAPGSAAAAAGLRPGDRILELNGTAVDHAGQVIRGVRLHPEGMPLRLTIERSGRRLEIRLQLPPRSDPQQAARDNGGLIRTTVLSSALSPP